MVKLAFVENGILRLQIATLQKIQKCFFVCFEMDFNAKEIPLAWRKSLWSFLVSRIWRSKQDPKPSLFIYSFLRGAIDNDMIPSWHHPPTPTYSISGENNPWLDRESSPNPSIEIPDFPIIPPPQIFTARPVYSLYLSVCFVMLSRFAVPGGGRVISIPIQSGLATTHHHHLSAYRHVSRFRRYSIYGFWGNGYSIPYHIIPIV